jgi:hypothetical protein
VVQRRQRTEHAGVGDEDVEPPPAPIESLAEPIDRVVVLEIEGDQSGAVGIAGIGGSDLVVQRFQRPLGSRHRDDVNALRGQGQRRRAPDPSRGAGDHGDAGRLGRGGLGHKSSGRDQVSACP